MRNRRLLRRAAQGVRDPWVLLLAALGGGGAWALDIPAAGAAGVTAAMLAAGAVTAVFTAPDAMDQEAPAPDPRLRAGTEQADLVRTLEAYIGDLRGLRESRLPAAVTDPAIEALVAAGGARDVAVRVAAAVDGLDDAVERAAKVHTRWAGRGGTGSQVGAAVERMRERRTALLGKLDRAVGEVAEVYTKLLELSATADTVALAQGGVGEVEDVNRSLDSLRGALAELEADARSARGLAAE